MFCMPVNHNWTTDVRHISITDLCSIYSAQPVCTEILLGKEQGVQGRTVSVWADITFCYDGSVPNLSGYSLTISIHLYKIALSLY